VKVERQRVLQWSDLQVGLLEFLIFVVHNSLYILHIKL
jgi:hypothetical protein